MSAYDLPREIIAGLEYRVAQLRSDLAARDARIAELEAQVAAAQICVNYVRAEIGAGRILWTIEAGDLPPDSPHKGIPFANL